MRDRAREFERDDYVEWDVTTSDGQPGTAHGRFVDFEAWTDTFGFALVRGAGEHVHRVAVEDLRHDLVAFIKAWAQEHYNEGGWDYLVETYTDDEIRKELARVTTPHGAVRKFRYVLGLRDERRRDIEATAF